MAIGALSALWAAGHRVPDDVSVVGYDDVVDAAYTIPPLTTVRFDKRELAEASLDLLTRRIAGHDLPISSHMVPHRIIRRASSRRAR
jgi:DNA-binding LacI/PurR family transcriptional regulator